MAQFIVPLFLACVLLVVFQPLHRWILSRLPSFPRVAALVTTILILSLVLLPLVWLGWNAYVELHALFAPKSGNVETAASANIELATPKDQTELAQDEVAFSERVNEIAMKIRDDIHARSPINIPDQTVLNLVASGKTFLAAKALSGVQSVIRILVGLAIMVIGLYYFLADGPAMIDTVMDLSPLDYEYEQELLARFGEVSRAVVVATLLSAVVQGTLAGIGYSFALSPGSPIFLLTALTMATALVPFVARRRFGFASSDGSICTASTS